MLGGLHSGRSFVIFDYGVINGFVYTVFLLKTHYTNILLSNAGEQLFVQEHYQLQEKLI